MKKISGENVEESSTYQSAKSRASGYANDPERLNDLLDKATSKARTRRGPLSQVWDSLMACLRLLRAYAAGSYRDIPWSSLLSIIAAVIYFVMPLDLIPDFILSFGFIDDAALFAWILSSLKADIEQFLEWENATAAAAAEELDGPAQEPENSA